MDDFSEISSISLEIGVFIIHLIPIFLAGRLVYLHYDNKLDNKENSKKIPLYTLQLLIAVSVSMFADSYASLENIKSKVAKIKESNERIEKQSNQIYGITQSTNSILINTSFKDQMTAVRKNFDPVLNGVFHEYIDGAVDFFDQGLNHGRITFKDNQRYRKSYVETFQYLNRVLKHPHMLARSLPDTNYFWSYKGNLRATEKAIKIFTESGGYLERIFFVEPNYLRDPVVVSILNRQIDSMHVDVRVINLNMVPKDEQQFFVINQEKKLMWVSQINPEREITTTTFSTNYEQDMKPIFAVFADIENDSKKYKPLEHNIKGK